MRIIDENTGIKYIIVINRIRRNSSEDKTDWVVVSRERYKELFRDRNGRITLGIKMKYKTVGVV